MLAEIAAASSLTVSSVPFIPVIPPVFIKPDVMEQMARLEPKDDRYHIPSDDLYLVGSAEHTLGPLHRNETLEERTLPRRYIGFSSAFRREAGSYGKDVHGILRLHQFDKLEIESFTTPETSQTEQDFIVAIQERIVQGLELPYRVVLKCTADQGDPDTRAIDIEAWFPGQNRYRETHTSDLMTDYQARRLHTKVRRGSQEIEYVHMNDATAVAVGRIIAAILENGQREDGSILIPEVLRPFMGGKERIISDI
jgi:seryl-tRNA synthetase